VPIPFLDWVLLRHEPDRWPRGFPCPGLSQLLLGQNPACIRSVLQLAAR
jgi:hypothetical protein